jgi:hypothetical protein
VLISAIRAITANSNTGDLDLYFLLPSGSITAPDVVEFWRFVKSNLLALLTVVWDCKGIYVNATLGKENLGRSTEILAENLLVYASEQNPDEEILGWLKRRLANSPIKVKDALFDGLWEEILKL